MPGTDLRVGRGRKLEKNWWLAEARTREKELRKVGVSNRLRRNELVGIPLSLAKLADG